MDYVDVYGDVVNTGDWCIVCYNNFIACMIYKEGTHFYKPSLHALNYIKSNNKMPKVEFLNSGFDRRVIRITDEQAKKLLMGQWGNPTYDEQIKECMQIFEQRLR